MERQAREAGRLAAERLRGGGEVVLRVTSGSMRPTICVGDDVTVRHAAVSDLKVGDVVGIQAEGTIVVHRLIRRSRDRTVISRGDATLLPDRSWRETDVVGVVTGVERGQRRLDLRSRRAGVVNWVTAGLARMGLPVVEAVAPKDGRLGRGRGVLVMLVRSPERVWERVTLPLLRG